jgi:hypothetical protein
MVMSVRLTAGAVAAQPAQCTVTISCVFVFVFVFFAVSNNEVCVIWRSLSFPRSGLRLRFTLRLRPPLYLFSSQLEELLSGVEAEVSQGNPSSYLESQDSQPSGSVAVSRPGAFR